MELIDVKRVNEELKDILVMYELEGYRIVTQEVRENSFRIAVKKNKRIMLIDEFIRDKEYIVYDTRPDVITLPNHFSTIEEVKENLLELL